MPQHWARQLPPKEFMTETPEEQRDASKGAGSQLLFIRDTCPSCPPKGILRHLTPVLTRAHRMYGVEELSF